MIGVRLISYQWNRITSANCVPNAKLTIRNFSNTWSKFYCYTQSSSALYSSMINISIRAFDTNPFPQEYHFLSPCRSATGCLNSYKSEFTKVGLCKFLWLLKTPKEFTQANCGKNGIFRELRVFCFLLQGQSEDIDGSFILECSDRH